MLDECQKSLIEEILIEVERIKEDMPGKNRMERIERIEFIARKFI